MWVVLLAAVLARAASADTFEVLIDDGGALSGSRFEGVGAITSNGETRLLYDYPEPQRTEILDLMFKPQSGMALQILKVEIGSGVQSTLGTEAPHVANLMEAPACNRGIQFWYASEARKRNPGITISALLWSAPGWVANASQPIVPGANAFFSTATIDYILSWLDCMRTVWQVVPDLVGTWNEAPVSEVPPAYLLALRAALDASGHYGSVQIVAADSGVGDGVSKALGAALLASPQLRAAVPVAGFHHPCGTVPTGWGNLTSGYGIRLYASEDYSLVGDAQGAACWGATPLRNWIEGGVVATIAWGAMYSALPNALCQNKGFLYATQPWSGAYTVAPAFWAMATYTWFTQPGWTLMRPGKGSGFLPPNSNGTSSHVSFLAPPRPAQSGAGTARDFTLIVSTQLCNVSCFTATSVSRGSLQVVLEGSTAVAAGEAGHVAVWCTNATAALTAVANISVTMTNSTSAQFTVPLIPDSLCAITSLISVDVTAPRRILDTISAAATGTSSSSSSSRRKIASSRHGLTVGTPAPFPMPWTDTFQTAANESYGPYFTDWDGSFQVIPDPAAAAHSAAAEQAAEGGQAAPMNVLRARLLQPPLPWHCQDVDPITMTAPGYANYDVSVAVRIDSNATAAARAKQQGGVPGVAADALQYAALVTRINKPFNGWCPTQTGYALAVYANGTWALQIWPGNAPAHPPPPAQLVLASGQVSGQAVDRWHNLNMVAFGTSLLAYVDGVQVADVNDATFDHGTVGLASGWHFASFASFSLAQVGPSPAAGTALYAQYLDAGRTNQFDGLVGTVVVALQPVVITVLGRFAAGGSVGIHEMYVIRAADNTTLGSASLNMGAGQQSIDPYGFSWARVSSPANGTLWLPAGEKVYIVSRESPGGDSHYHYGPAIPCAGDVTSRAPVMGVFPAAASLLEVTGSVYADLSSSSSGRWVWVEGGEGFPASLGPVNFMIQV